jgi:hypothetical protein
VESVQDFYITLADHFTSIEVTILCVYFIQL